MHLFEVNSAFRAGWFPPRPCTSPVDQEFLCCFCRLNRTVNRTTAPSLLDLVSDKLLPAYILRCTETSQRQPQQQNISCMYSNFWKNVVQMLGGVFQFSRSGRFWGFRYTLAEQQLAKFHLCRLLDSGCITVLCTKPAQLTGEPCAFLQS